jgi:hypothetical protein
MMVMVMAVMYYDHNLRLRRIGYCETEDEHESEQNSFHSISIPLDKSIYRATMTTARKLNREDGPRCIKAALQRFQARQNVELFHLRQSISQYKVSSGGISQ